jgi:isopentenyl-diphosphate Delta-isomerase
MVRLIRRKEHHLMKEVTHISSRKADHIKINLEENVRSGLTTGLENYHFTHRALPEIDLDTIELKQILFSRQVRAPILISSMTGGTEQASNINRVLAEAAQITGIAMGVGSQRVGLDHPELASTFAIRKFAPDALLFANLGAIQLNYGYTLDHCQRAVDMLEADALILHFNALQEAVQPEGNTHFAGLATQVERICRSLPVPVIAKEVGWGFSEPDVRLLVNCGISAIDVAGAGGTSWSQVEMHRAQTERQRILAEAFIDWGIPTAQAILNVQNVDSELPVIASGGLRSGLDIAKCIALGASLGGMAGPFLKTAVQSLEATIELINTMQQEIRICMFSTGSKDLRSFRDGRITKIVQ